MSDNIDHPYFELIIKQTAASPMLEFDYRYISWLHALWILDFEYANIGSEKLW